MMDSGVFIGAFNFKRKARLKSWSADVYSTSTPHMFSVIPHNEFDATPSSILETDCGLLFGVTSVRINDERKEFEIECTSNELRIRLQSQRPQKELNDPEQLNYPALTALKHLQRQKENQRLKPYSRTSVIERGIQTLKSKGYEIKTERVKGLFGGPSQLVSKLISLPNQTETTKMKTLTKDSLTIFLVNDDVRAIKAVYDRDPNDKGWMGDETFPNFDSRNVPPKLFKTFDQSIEVGDYVIVETQTRHGMTVCKVTEVDVEVDFDNGNANWCVGKIDIAEHVKLRENEKKLIATVHKAEKRRKRDELKAAIMKDNEEEFAGLKLVDHSAPEIEPDENK